MSQNIADKTDAAEVKTQETRGGFMQQVRVAAWISDNAGCAVSESTRCTVSCEGKGW